MRVYQTMPKRLLFLGFTWVCLTQPLPALSADSRLTQAQELLKQGKANEAHALLSASEAENAGDIEYDYLLGIAALDAGKSSQASLAFERVLASNPNHAGARLDLGRAYYAMGDMTRAKLEFQTVLAQDPPAAARNVVEQHLDAITRQEKMAQGAWTGYIEASAGYDDNLTSVTSDFTQAVLKTYNLPNIQPTGNAIKREDTFYGLAGNAEYRQKINPQDTLFGGLEARYRHYLGQHLYDSATAGVYGGIERSLGQEFLRLAVSVQKNQQEGETQGTPKPRLDRDSRGINAEWRHTVDGHNQAALFAQYNQLRYPDIPDNDIDQTTLGGAWMHLFQAPSQPMAAVIVFRTNENALHQLSNGSDYGKRITGLRLAGQFNLHPDLTPFASLGRQWRDDTRISARLDGVTGKDRLWEATLGLNWQIERDWLLKPQLYLARNTSNIPLYEYTRSEFSVTLRKDFR